MYTYFPPSLIQKSSWSLRPDRKALDDPFHDMYAGRRVAVDDTPPDHGFRAREDPLGALGEIPDDVVLVDEGDIHRQRIQHSHELIELERSGRHDDEPRTARRFQAVRRRSALLPASTRAAGEMREIADFLAFVCYQLHSSSVKTSRTMGRRMSSSLEIMSTTLVSVPSKTP